MSTLIIVICLLANPTQCEIIEKQLDTSLHDCKILALLEEKLTRDRRKRHLVRESFCLAGLPIAY